MSSIPFKALKIGAETIIKKLNKMDNLKEKIYIQSLYIDKLI